MAIISAVVLARNDHTGSNPLRIDVTAQQFAWTFKYPQQKGLTTSVLSCRSTGRRGSRSGRSTSSTRSGFRNSGRSRTPARDRHAMTVTPNKIGTYPIICTELCGLGHAVMRSTVVVMSQADFDKWAKAGGKRPAAEAELRPARPSS